jgi:THO complex subunit 1
MTYDPFKPKKGLFTNLFEQGITQLKDQSFAARYIFLAPPDISELQQRLRQRGSNTEDKIKDRLEIAEKELAQAKVEGFHDKILVNDNLQTAFEQLESYIFGFDATDEDGKDAEAVSTELEMGDGELQIDDGKLNDDVEAGDKIAAPAEDIAMAADAHDTTGTADRLNTE